MHSLLCVPAEALLKFDNASPGLFIIRLNSDNMHIVSAVAKKKDLLGAVHILRPTFHGLKFLASHFFF